MLTLKVAGILQLRLQTKEIRMHWFIRAFVFLALFAVSKISLADPLVFMPFPSGEQWKCSQGPGGSFSHTGSLSQAYDLNLTGNLDLGEDVRSPVEGTVVEVVKTLDNVCGSGAGWGNYVIIQSTNGKYVRLAHMIKNSIVVNLGEIVWVGKMIGQVGCTGFADGPHLHMQVQDGQGTSSVPFRFIEGPMTCNNSTNHTSRLITRGSMIDNMGETSLGNRLQNTSVSTWGGWNQSTGAPGYVSYDYHVHQVTDVDLSYFIWSFQVKKSGTYSIYANWTANPNRDTCAYYTVDVNGQPLFTSNCVNQTIGNGKVNFQLVTSGLYLSAGNTYEVEVHGDTTGKYVVADAIVIAGGP